MLPCRVDAMIDNVGTVTWDHSLKSVKPGGVVVINGMVSGHMADTNLVPIFVEQLDVCESWRGRQVRFRLSAGGVLRSERMASYGRRCHSRPAWQTTHFGRKHS